MKSRLASLGIVFALLQISLLGAQPPAEPQRPKGKRDAPASPARDPATRDSAPREATPGDTAPRDTRPKDPAAANGRMVTLEVLIAEVPGGLASPAAAAILELDKAGKLAGRMRVRLAALENQTARVQFGETVPRITGRTFQGGAGGRGGFGAIPNYTDVNVGTLVQAISRVDGDGSVIANLTLERSGLAAAPASRAVAGGEPVAEQPPVGIGQLTLQTTVRIKPGEAIVIGGREAVSGQETSETWVVVMAQVGGTAAGAATSRAAGPPPPPPPTPVSELRVFTLKNSSAPDLAPILSDVFAGQPLRFSADPRTNSILVIGPAANLQTAQSLVTRLDAEK